MIDEHAVSRRDFLRLAGAGAFSLAVAACAAPSTPAQQDAAAGEGGASPSQATSLLRIQANEEDLAPVVELFRETHTDVDVEYFNITGIDHEEVASKMLSLIAAGLAVVHRAFGGGPQPPRTDDTAGRRNVRVIHRYEP